MDLAKTQPSAASELVNELFHAPGLRVWHRLDRVQAAVGCFDRDHDVHQVIVAPAAGRLRAPLSK
jgi:hypothetical protein